MSGCNAKLAQPSWWNFCGETDMGQTAPVLCTECGGEYLRMEDFVEGGKMLDPRADIAGQRAIEAIEAKAVTGKDPGKGHFIISMVKSVLRIVGCFMLLLGVNSALILFALLFLVAELLGIVEELVD